MSILERPIDAHPVDSVLLFMGCPLMLICIVQGYIIVNCYILLTYTRLKKIELYGKYFEHGSHE